MDNHYTRKNSLRLKGYDYSLAGAYFLTMCVQDRACLFGLVVDGNVFTARQTTRDGVVFIQDNIKVVLG